MKNLILISLFLLMGCASRKEKNIATKNPINEDASNISIASSTSYKPLNDFKSDTLAFVQQSILDRKGYYRGKELSVLINDLGIPIKIYSYGRNPENILLSNYLIILINNYFQQDAKLARGEDPINLVVTWEKPIDYEKLDKISKENKFKWTKEVEAYLGKQIVGDIVKTDYKLDK